MSHYEIMLKRKNYNQLFDRLKNILRQSDDHITGRDAVFDISQLITLKKLEDTNRIEYFGLPDYCKFSSIVKAIELYEKNLEQNHIQLYGNIETNVLNKGIFTELTNNKHTRQAFTSDLHYQKLNTHISLIKEIHKFGDISNDCEYDDTLGSQYEVLLRTQLVGKDDGQYFTNRNIVKLIINEIKPVIGETIYDPTSGTGGFLIWSYLYLKSQVKTHEHVQILSENPLYGCDIDKYVMQLLHCNLLFNDIKHNDHFKCCNTIIDNMYYDKYDVILSNFPFGKKGGDIFNMANIDQDKLFDYYGFKTKILPILFLKHTINILKTGGRAAVIVTTGELSNVGKAYDLIRKELVEKCSLTKIIILPKGIFDNAPGVSTAILFFVKGSKTNKVEFQDQYLKQIKTVNYDQIVKNKYRLDPQGYVDDIINNLNVNVNKLKLKDICTFKNGKTLSKKDMISGPYLVIGGGKLPLCSHIQFNTDENTILISSSGSNAGYITRYKSKVWASDSFSIKSNNEKLNNDYLYYCLLLNQNKFYELQKGVAQPHVYSSDCQEITIPIPNINLQEKIVNFLEQNQFPIRELSEYFNINLLKLLLENKFDHINAIYITYNAILSAKQYRDSIKVLIKNIINSVVHSHQNKKKQLKYLCQIQTGSKIKTNIKGPYRIYGGGNSNGTIDKYNRINKLVIAKDAISRECVRFVSGKFFLSNHGWTLKIIDNRISEQYLNYFLLYNQDLIYNLAQGTVQKGINQDKFYNKIIIPIPSCYRQDIIIHKIKEKELELENLKRTIIDAKENIEIIMKNYLK